MGIQSQSSKKKKQLNKSISYKKSQITFSLQNGADAPDSPQIALLKQSEEIYGQQLHPAPNSHGKKIQLKQIAKQSKSQFGETNWQDDNAEEQQNNNRKEINEQNVASNKFLYYI